MAYEFKKISDVNTIETMKDGLNVLVEDGGEIVKISANNMVPENVALKSDIPTGIVKSVNGVMPDEDGNITSDYAFQARFIQMQGNIIADKTPMEIWNALLNNNVCSANLEYVDLENGISYYCERYENINVQSDEGTWIKTRVLHFNGDKIAPIVVNITDNTITLDPNWVAPKIAINTINGKAPDENGELSTFQVQPFVFIDGTSVVPGMFQYGGATPISDIIDMLRNNNQYHVDCKRLIMGKSNSMTIRSYTAHEFVLDENSQVIGAKLHFGEDLCPVIIKYDNTITADPDWVAPKAVVNTINGEAPDENGDLTVRQATTVTFQDLAGDLVSSHTAEEIKNLMLDNTSFHGLKFAFAVKNFALPMGPWPIYYHTRIDEESFYTGSSHLMLKYHIYFGDEVAPIIVDCIEGTITIDPDWVAIEKPIIPETIEPNKQLVTDASGKKMWEERTHYSTENLVVILPEANILDKKSAVLGDYSEFTQNLVKDHTYTVVYNGTEYKSTAWFCDILYAVVLGNGSLASLGDNTGEPFFINNYMNSASTFIYFSEQGDHTISINDGTIEEVKPLEEKYLPTSVPTINTASVGQTIVVKTVDENGKPTEWEVSNKFTELSEELAAQNTAKVTLPQSAGVVDYGTAGQIAVSDGKGGIVWKTFVEAEEVSY